MKKVYVVIGNEYKGIYGVYTNKAEAEKAAEKASWCAEMEGSRAHYRVEEHEVK